MSHLSVSGVRFKSIDLIKDACDRLGWTFKENQKTYNWFGQVVGGQNDVLSAANNGVKPENYGKCLHAISIPGSSYEIGIIDSPDGNGYAAIYDFWHKPLKRAIGGENAEHLQDAYAVATVYETAREQCGYDDVYDISETVNPNGEIVLTVTVGDNGGY